MKKNWIQFGVLALITTLSLMPARADDAFIRVLHGLSLGSKVDVYIDGYKKYNDVEFSDLTKYIRVPAGYRTVRVATNENARTISSTKRTFRRGEFYTIGVYGVPSRVRVLNGHDSSGETLYGQARLTAYNLSPGMKPFNVVAYLKGGRILRIVNNVSYGQGKSGNIPATALSVRLVRNGRILQTITGVSPRAGRKYAAYAIGRPSRNFRVLLDKTASQ